MILKNHKNKIIVKEETLNFIKIDYIQIQNIYLFEVYFIKLKNLL
jgi:hypothetical protein